MNAVSDLLAALPRDALARAIRTYHSDPDVARGTTRQMRHRLGEIYALDLAGLLNRSERRELELAAAAWELPTTGRIGELRARLWLHGAHLEAGAPELLGGSIQPVPIVLRGKLVYLGRDNGTSPETDVYPRSIPPPDGPPDPDAEPDSLEQLLDNADRLLGVRLGAGVRDKGAFGIRIASLLGVPERGYSEPDWRGEVEIKTVPVVLDRAGWWRVKEDPAISMENASPIAKLARVLWIARVADAADSPILSWYYQEWDDAVSELVSRHLHTRPKGGAGATTRGWYLHKRFFIESGFLRSLNG